MKRVFRIIAGFLLCLLAVRNLLVLRHTHAVGEYGYFVADNSDAYCDDSRPVFLSINANGNLAVNAIPLARGNFIRDMQVIYKTRCERVLFLTADANLPFGTVIDRIGQLHASIEYLNIALLTGHEQLKSCAPSIRHWERLHLRDCSTAAP
jgi:hypothetical protein